MKEEFLHYLWKYRLYDRESLRDPDNNPVEVIKTGEYNRDSGPDFFNAMISVSGIVWAGNVEIHTKSSHFDIHGHQRDPAFDNVILHVVGQDDRKVYNSKGKELLTVTMKFDPGLYDKYMALVNNPCTIACQDEFRNVESMIISSWLSSLVAERLMHKSEKIKEIFSETGNDWEETFYRVLARYFGFRVNTEPFEMLARNIPLKIIRKHTDNRFQIEALLFGTAGMLEEGLFREALADGYYRDLAREFRVMSAKYSLQPVHGKLWKFSRLRPVNFPTIRISQLAGMLEGSGGLFSRVLESRNISELKEIFEVSASGYWNDHYVFGRKSRSVIKITGSQATDIFLINAVIPVVFVYGLSRDMNGYVEKALAFLEAIGPEDNIIVKEWLDAGATVSSAFCTQAYLQLREEYCRKRRCLSCRIGNHLIRQGRDLKEDHELMLEPLPG